MKLISVITGDEAAFGCDYALVDLTPQLVRQALSRIAMLKEKKRIDQDLDEMYFWDQHAEYFSPWTAETADQADTFAEMMGRLPSMEGDLQNAPAEFTVPESLRARVECCQMVVREDAIAFVAIPKHASCYVRTAEIPLRLIEAAATA
jgi:hypothetical protein